MSSLVSRARISIFALILCVSTVPDTLAGVRSQPIPRDAATPSDAPDGTATIIGRVVAADTGRPVKRAYVRATAGELPGGRAALTDVEGRYVLEELPAGRYTVRVSKTGFVSVAFGQRRPLQSGTPVDVGDAEELEGIDFQLPRGSVITGHVIDEDAAPMAGVVVQVLRHVYRQGERRLVPTGRDQSDDRGQFRVFGLAPGTYYISAVARFVQVARGFGRSRAENLEEPTGYAPTYYPGVLTISEAAPVTVGVGEEAANVNFPIQLVSTVRVSGIVINPDGSPGTPASVILSPDDDSQFFSAGSLGARTDGDGSFSVVNVPPGRYVVFARSGGRRFDNRLFATLTITVAGQEVSGLALMLTAGADVAGTVTFESGTTTPPGDVTRIRVTARAVRSTPFEGNTSANVRPDGTFELSNVPAGARLLRVSGAPEPWSLKAVYVEGRNVVDAPVEFPGGVAVANVGIVLVDRSSELSGVVRDHDGHVRTDFTVIAFPTDSSLWWPESRQIGVGRPDQNGRYQIRGLPAGEYFLVAVDAAEQGAWFDSQFLETISRGAARLNLGEGEAKALDLELAAPRP